MRVTKPESIGDMPPSTRRSAGLSARTASPAPRTISLKISHSGSCVSKSQCDLLFGSFQNITASSMRPPSSRVVLHGAGGRARRPADMEHPLTRVLRRVFLRARQVVLGGPDLVFNQLVENAPGRARGTRCAVVETVEVVRHAEDAE